MIQSPYIYVYDGSGLTDGQSYQRLHLEMRDGNNAFALRRIAGLNTLATSMNLYAPGTSQKRLFARAARIGNNHLVAPELVFDGRQSFVFDLNTVNRSVTACGTNIYTSFLAFQGVRTLDGDAPRQYSKARPFTLSYSLTVDWYRYVSLPAAAIERPRRFAIPIDTHDFELHRIRIRNADGTAVATNFFQILLYDALDRPLSNAPLLQSFVNNLASGYNSVFPVPPVLYPVRRDLRFDITSLICNTDVTFPKSYTISFEGVQRYD